MRSSGVYPRLFGEAGRVEPPPIENSSGTPKPQASLIHGCILAISTFLYFTVGDGASVLLSWACLLAFYAMAVAALRRPVCIIPGLPSFANIEVFFLTFSYLLFFWPYQQYVLGHQDLNVSSFVHGSTFADDTNKSLILSTLAVAAFSCGIRAKGALRKKPRPQGLSISAQMANVLVTVTFFAQIATMGLYLAAGWRSTGEGRYTGTDAGGSVADGVNTLVLMFSMIAIALVISARLRGQALLPQAWASLLLSSFWAIRILLLGDRNSFLLIVLVAIAGVLTFRIRAGRAVLALMLVVGLFMYSGVQAVRSTGNVSLSAILNAAGGSETASPRSDSSFDITTIGARAATAVVPAQVPFGYGRYKVLGFMGILPLVRGELIGSWSDSLHTSTDIVTDAVIGPSAGWSIGTNVVSDVYVDFAVPGVALILYLLGFFAAWMENWVRGDPRDPRRLVMYLLVVSLFAELPRYALDFPVRMLVWGAIFLALATVLARVHSKGPVDR